MCCTGNDGSVVVHAGKCLSQAAKEVRLDRRKHDVEPVELVLQQVATLGESWL